MSDEVTEVVVQVSDVDKMHAALQTSYWLSVLEDTKVAYRTLDSDGRRSKSALTGQLADALQAAEAIMKLAENETTIETPDPEESDPESSG